MRLVQMIVNGGTPSGQVFNQYLFNSASATFSSPNKNS